MTAKDMFAPVGELVLYVPYKDRAKPRQTKLDKYMVIQEINKKKKYVKLVYKIPYSMMHLYFKEETK